MRSYLRLRGFAPQFQLSQPVIIKMFQCEIKLNTEWTIKSVWHLCIIKRNSYPNKWHKFLTGVLIRAVQREKEAVSETGGGCEHFNNSKGAHEHSMVLEGEWLWHDLHHVPSQWKWYMTGLGGMGSSWGHITMRWMRGLLLTTKRRQGLSYQPVLG